MKSGFGISLLALALLVGQKTIAKEYLGFQEPRQIVSLQNNTIQIILAHKADFGKGVHDDSDHRHRRSCTAIRCEVVETNWKKGTRITKCERHKHHKKLGTNRYYGDGHKSYRAGNCH